MGIKKMEEFRKLTELRRWYWEELACDLYEEAEEELRKGDKWFGVKNFFGLNLDRVKELQAKKFSHIFNKIKSSAKKGSANTK